MEINREESSATESSKTQAGEIRSPAASQVLVPANLGGIPANLVLNLQKEDRGTAGPHCLNDCTADPNHGVREVRVADAEVLPLGGHFMLAVSIGGLCRNMPLLSLPSVLVSATGAERSSSSVMRTMAR